MTSLLQLNYDELTQIACYFADEGEEIMSQYFLLAQRLYSLRQDWQGKAADTFFKEMEEIVLPAHKKAGESLFLADETTRKLMKIISSADEETRQMFMTDEFGAYSPQSGSSRENIINDENLNEGSLGVPTLNVRHGNSASEEEDHVPEQESQISGANSKSNRLEPTMAEAGPSSAMNNNVGTLGASGNLSELGNSLESETLSTDSKTSEGVGNVAMPDHLYSTNDNIEENTLNETSEQQRQDNKKESSLGNAVAGIAGASAAIGTAGKVVQEVAKKSSK